MKIERHQIEHMIAALRGGSKRERRAAVMLAWLLDHMPRDYM